MLHTNPWWTIQIPDHWEVDQDEHCTTFTDPVGVGALQISAARKEAGPVTAGDLEEFSEDALATVGSPKIPWQGWFSGFAVEYVAEGDFWKKWWLAAGNTLVSVTYCCTAEDLGGEEQVAGQAVETLRPRTTGV